MYLSIIVITVAVAFIIMLWLLSRLARRDVAEFQPGADPAGAFVFVKIPDPVQPADRAEKYEQPLDIALQATAHGRVAGGGTIFSDEDAEGKQVIAWVGLDVELNDLEKGLPLLKAALKRLGVPPGTRLEYWQDEAIRVEPVS